jgi:3'(2'), 5'-bisphosphate nucleotidase
MTAERQSTGDSDASRLLMSVATLVADAGRSVIEITAADFSTRRKADESPVTDADEAAEAIITRGLEKILPGVPVIAEEAAARSTPAVPKGAYWLVDPIDGTREMLAGYDEFTVNVALVDNRTPVLGVIYAPKRSTLYAGTGSTAWRTFVAAGTSIDHRQLAPIHVRSRPEQLVALVSRSHFDAASESFLFRLPVAQKLLVGSSLKFALLAEGTADIYARIASINEWDIAAGQALLAAAGGRVTAPDGSALTYGGRNGRFLVDGFVAWGGEPSD